MKVGALRGADYNPRKITEQELASLRQAMEVFGDLGGITFNRRTGNLVGGHQRVKTLDPEWNIIFYPITSAEEMKTGTIRRGWIETPFGGLSFREVDWDEKIERAANLAANKHGGSWDDKKLADLLVGLDDGSPLLELTGFKPVDLEGLIGRGPKAELPSEAAALFEQLTFVLTKEQLALIGFALDLAIRAGEFKETGNKNARGNALARIAAAYRGIK